MTIKRIKQLSQDINDLISFSHNLKPKLPPFILNNLIESINKSGTRLIIGTTFTKKINSNMRI